MKILKIILLILFTGCTANYETIANKTSLIAARQGLVPKIYQTKNFKIYTLQKISNPKAKVRIYFEGDGKAFITRNIASPNPTPTSYFLINLIAQDHSANVIYIARPCQFVQDPKCYGVGAEKNWTNGRFSKEVIDSINEVMMDFRAHNIELIGYSGGANIMKYAAISSQKHYGNVLNLRTIAGNLNNEKFSQIHHVKAEYEFYDDESLSQRLSKIPQIHFVGGSDEIIPEIIAQSYRDKLPVKNCVQIIKIPTASHSSGWEENWHELLKIKPSCHQNKAQKIEKTGLFTIKEVKYV